MPNAMLLCAFIAFDVALYRMCWLPGEKINIKLLNDATPSTALAESYPDTDAFEVIGYIFIWYELSGIVWLS